MHCDVDPLHAGYNRSKPYTMYCFALIKYKDEEKKHYHQTHKIYMLHGSVVKIYI